MRPRKELDPQVGLQDHCRRAKKDRKMESITPLQMSDSGKSKRGLFYFRANMIWRHSGLMVLTS